MNVQPEFFEKKAFPIIYTALAVLGIAAFLLQTQLPEGGARIALANLFQCSILALALVAGARLALNWLGELGYQKRECVLLSAFMLAAYIAGFFFFRYFFNAEQDIKVYDSTVYWIKVIEDRQAIGQSIPGYLSGLLDTFSQEYTHLAAFPLIPVSYLLGLEFAGYCFSVFSIYYLPACFFATILALRLLMLAREEKPGVTAFIVCFCLCALSVAFLWPVMRGYLDVAGVLIVALMLNLTLRWNGVDFDWKRNTALAALSFALLFTRRWYAYYIVGFYFSFGAAALIGMIADKNLSAKKLGSLFLNMGMIAGLSCLCIFLINPEIFSLFLLKDYALAYSAYKGMSMWQNLWSVAANIGLLWVAAGFAGAGVLLANGKSRLICIRLLLAVAVAVILFCGVQDMGFHHHYLILPSLLVLGGVFCVFAIQRFSMQNMPVLAVPVLVLCLLNLSFGFEPALQRIAAATEPLTTAMRGYPIKNRDYDTFRQVVRELRDKVGDTSQKVYVVGDSRGLSPEFLKRGYLPELVDAAPFVLVNNIVDLRDGFPSQLFLADYVLVSDPFRTDFQSVQQVSYQIYDMLLHDPKMAEYYQPDGTYHAAEENFLLYRKVRPIDSACVDVLRQRLKSFYPDQPFVYEPNYFIALSEFGDKVRYTFNVWEKAFTLHKEAGTPLNMSLNDTRAFSSLSFSLSCWAPGLELIVRNQSGEIYRGPVAVGEKALYNIAVAGSDFLSLAVAEAEPGARLGGLMIMYAPELK